MISPELTRMLITSSQAKRFHSGETIVSEGLAPVEGLGFLLSGSVKITKKQGEREIILGTIEAGHSFGETALLLQRPRIATVRAASDDTVAIFLSPESFTREANRNTSFLEHLTNEAVIRIDNVLAALFRLKSKTELIVDPSLKPIIEENRKRCSVIHDLINNTRALWVGHDKPLFSQGEHNNGTAFLVVQGSIVWQRRYDDETVKIHTVEPGDIFGLPAPQNSPFRRYTTLPLGESARVVAFGQGLLGRVLRANQDTFFYVFRSLITQVVILDDSLRLAAAKVTTPPIETKPDTYTTEPPITV